MFRARLVGTYALELVRVATCALALGLVKVSEQLGELSDWLDPRSSD